VRADSRPGGIQRGDRRSATCRIRVRAVAHPCAKQTTARDDLRARRLRIGARPLVSGEARASAFVRLRPGARPEEERARRLCGRSLGGECARVRKEDSLPSTDEPSGEKGLSMIEVHMRLRSIARPRRSSMSSSTFMATIAGSQHRTRSGASPISPRASPISPRIRWLSGRPILSLGPRACVTERLWSSSHRRR